MKTFTSDWFSRHIPLFERHLIQFKGQDNINFLEIGSYEGRSACWMLDNILTGKNNFMFCCDTFEGSPEHDPMKIDYSNIFDTFMENVKQYGNKVVVLKGVSQEMLRDLPLKYYDFIYIDGSHNASDVLEDAVQSWRLLKPGGIMAFDDYNWSFWSNRYGEPSQIIDEEMLIREPKIAIDAFLKLFKHQYKLLEQSDQIWIQKV